MTVTAFDGAAGTGKTHRLMDHVGDRMRVRPLVPHERVLALTFMNGARRRLESRLRRIAGLDGHYEASTVDSFAWRLVQRWRGLVASLGQAIPPEEQYGATCSLAATLLSRPAVKSWVAVSFPLLLVDEAQDLSVERSAMVEAAAAAADIVLAYDEFQCLDPALRPMPIKAWLPGMCIPVSLTRCRRTNDTELLAAAGAVRDGRSLNQHGRGFKVVQTPREPLAATYLTNFIAWRGTGRVAVLTPSRSGEFADRIVDLVRTRPLGKQGKGPYPITWESGDEIERADLCKKLAITERCSIPDALAALSAHAGVPAARIAAEWIARQKRVLGIEDIAAGDVRRQIEHIYAMRRRQGAVDRAEFVAMTIQQAKNREFDHVVVIWPYRIPNNDEQKRRLLYNAITRAQRSCLVLVQGKELMQAPPFVA